MMLLGKLSPQLGRLSPLLPQMLLHGIRDWADCSKHEPSLCRVGDVIGSPIHVLILLAPVCHLPLQFPQLLAVPAELFRRPASCVSSLLGAEASGASWSA